MKGEIAAKSPKWASKGTVKSKVCQCCGSVRQEKAGIEGWVIRIELEGEGNLVTRFSSLRLVVHNSALVSDYYEGTCNRAPFQEEGVRLLWLRSCSFNSELCELSRIGNSMASECWVSDRIMNSEGHRISAGVMQLAA